MAKAARAKKPAAPKAENKGVFIAVCQNVNGQPVAAVGDTVTAAVKRLQDNQTLLPGIDIVVKTRGEVVETISN